MTAPGGQQYSAPRYYEIAFDMNRRQEVNFLVHCFRRYARRRVRAVLDIACGTGPHLIRLAGRGYVMSGLDLSPQNIAFLKDRTAEPTIKKAKRNRLPRFAGAIFEITREEASAEC